MTREPRLVEVRRNILKQNDVIARELREQFTDAGVCVASMVSSPGSGKTALLEDTLTRLSENHRVAALVGDLATENDAARLARSGAPVRQITTGTVCHLEAAMVRSALEGWQLGELDFLFVENVGNLVCPAGWDLGEVAKIVVFSVTEGEDKPLKYPAMFRKSRYAVLNKIDLLPYLEFDVALAMANARSINPELQFFLTSARTGEGLEAWYEFLRSAVRATATA
jgi:hydrogenase nickel incorporation protein HypB